MRCGLVMCCVLLAACSKRQVSWTLPGICDLERADPLLVKASITSVGSPTTIGQEGLPQTESQTLILDPAAPLTPLTIDVERTVIGAEAKTSMAVLETVIGDGEAPPPFTQPDGGQVEGYFFLSMHNGLWVIASGGGFFGLDPVTGKLENGAAYGRSNEIVEADFLAQVSSAAALSPSASCEQPAAGMVCCDGGTVVPSAGDAG